MRRLLVGLAVALVAGLVVPGLACGRGAATPSMRFDHPGGSGPPAPLVVYIHGGGWQAGDKLTDAAYLLMRPRLLAQGIAVASLDYRLAPAHRFPAQINDVTAAVRSLRSRARELRVDPDRIAAAGTSAGGHLASLLGTIDRSAGFDVGAPARVSSRVRAVVDIAGPVDLTDPSLPPDNQDAIQEAFGVRGGTAGDPTLGRASPVTYVSPDDPPFLLVHGTLDELVPFSQSVTFADRLKAAGVRAELVPVEGAGHSLSTPGQRLTPDQIADRIGTFLVTELRR